MIVPLPAGFRLAIDVDTKQLDDTTLFGGMPARVLRMSAGGVAAWTELRDGPVCSANAGALARRLTDTGLAHPRPPDPQVAPDVTVVIPVKDRPTMLARCLSSLGGAFPVVVVDDGSSDERALADVVAGSLAKWSRSEVRRGSRRPSFPLDARPEDPSTTPVRGSTGRTPSRNLDPPNTPNGLPIATTELVRRATSGGPGAARATGLDEVRTEFVAFLDSDCVATDGWIEALAAHFADPLVAAVAPRVVALPSETSAGHYAETNGSLDLGDREARCVPGTRVSYVPTAALVVRRAALLDVARDGAVFDPALRYGEDVDLIWRLHEAGWRVRYDPAVRVHHEEPASWPGVLKRRFHYGTSAGPLARRHPGAMAPLVLQPWPTLTVLALLSRRPLLAGASFAASVLAMNRTVRRAGLPVTGVVGAMRTGAHQTWLGVGRYGTQFAAPLLAAGLVAPGGSTTVRRWGRRAAIASLLLGRPLTTWFSARPTVDPLRFVLGHVADDVAYGAGVWAGCVRARTAVPLRPKVSWRPFRVGRAVEPTSQVTTKGSS